MIVAEGSTVNLILPVRACCSESSVRNAFRSIHILNKAAVFVTRHHVKRLLTHADGGATSIGDRGLHILTALLGGDDDDTVRTTTTIDGCGGSVFQHVEGFDILRVDHREGVGKTFYTLVIHSQTVNHNQGVV